MGIGGGALRGGRRSRRLRVERHGGKGCLLLQRGVRQHVHGVCGANGNFARDGRARGGRTRGNLYHADQGHGRARQRLSAFGNQHRGRGRRLCAGGLHGVRERRRRRRIHERYVLYGHHIPDGRGGRHRYADDGRDLPRQRRYGHGGNGNRIQPEKFLCDHALF